MIPKPEDLLALLRKIEATGDRTEMKVDLILAAVDASHDDHEQRLRELEGAD